MPTYRYVAVGPDGVAGFMGDVTGDSGWRILGTPWAVLLGVVYGYMPLMIACALGVDGVAHRGIDHPIRAAIDEADRGIIAVLHFPYRHMPIDRVVRHVDAGAERSVDDQLHAAAFIEETLGNDGALGRNIAQHGAAFEDVLNGLLGGGLLEAGFLLKPRYRLFQGASLFLWR